jgi:hypothetical protein
MRRNDHVGDYSGPDLIAYQSAATYIRGSLR